MITDRIGQHKVLLPVNHNYNQICDILKENTRNSESSLASSEKNPFKCTQAVVHTGQLLNRHDAYCPITLSYQL